jgi:hypothetical protein
MVCGLLGVSLLDSSRWPGVDQACGAPEAEEGDEARCEGFPFAADRGGKLLSQALQPSENEATRKPAVTLEPRRFPDLDSRQRQEVPLTPLPPELPKARALPPVRLIRPQPLPEEPPLARSWLAPVLPEKPQFAVSPGVRLPSLKLEQPSPVPILAQPPSAPASADHPTADFSTAAALAAPLPDRTRPVPFVRLVLPDPFEHVQAVRLKAPPPDVELPAAPSPLPGR